MSEYPTISVNHTFKKSEAHGVVNAFKQKISLMNPNLDYQLIFGEKPKARSLEMNAYFWGRVRELSLVLDETPISIYKTLVRDVAGGCIQLLVKKEAVDDTIAAFTDGYTGRQAYIVGETEEGSIIDLYMGSSDYTTKQMRHLINLLHAECELQGIDTASEQEMSLYYDEWSAKEIEQHKEKEKQTKSRLKAELRANDKATGSILQSKIECYVTQNDRRADLHCHHIYPGEKRQISEKHGFKVWLAEDIHIGSGVHADAEFMLELQQVCQQTFEAAYSRKMFVDIIGKNYL